MPAFSCFLNSHYLYFLFFLLVDDKAEKGGNTLSVNGSKYLQISGSEMIGKCLFSSRAKILERLSPESWIRTRE